jgi:hypothetical protein
MNYKYNAIKLDSDLELDFCKYYQNNLIQLNNLLDNRKLSQEQFLELQKEFFNNSFEDFYIQRVECNSDLIEIV